MEQIRSSRLLGQIVDQAAALFKERGENFQLEGEEYYSISHAIETVLKTLTLRPDELLSTILQQTTFSPKQVFGNKIEIETEKYVTDETGENYNLEVERSWEEVVNGLTVRMLEAEFVAKYSDLEQDASHRYEIAFDH